MVKKIKKAPIDFGMGSFMAKLTSIAPPPAPALASSEKVAVKVSKKKKRIVRVVRKRRKITTFKSIKEARDLATTQESVDTTISQLEELPVGDCKAEELLGLMYVQENMKLKTKELLLDCGYCYRLSDHVLRYPVVPSNPTKISKKKSECYVTAFDDVLPQNLFSSLKNSFRPDSLFWSEHNYKVGVTPYFSYRQDLSKPPSNTIDQAISEVASLMIKEIISKNPDCEQPLYAEWWVHSRPHPHGHQMHFDADNEGKGGVRNPLANCILFLSEDCGGPTLITSQEYGQTKLSQEGWFAYSKENRMVAYPANVLHGVVPGRGPIKETSLRRQTLMIALWGKSGCSLRPSPVQGASRPYPVEKSSGDWYTNKDPNSYSWPSEFIPIVKPVREAQLKRVSPSPIPYLWEDVCTDINSEDDKLLSNLTSIPHYDVCFQGF